MAWASAHTPSHVAMIPRLRSSASSGSSGRPMMVKWSPLMRSEQLDAAAFYLVAADGAENCRPGLGQVGVEVGI
jgi:hypothetical protein